MPHTITRYFHPILLLFLSLLLSHSLSNLLIHTTLLRQSIPDPTVLGHRGSYFLPRVFTVLSPPNFPLLPHPSSPFAPLLSWCCSQDAQLNHSIHPIRSISFSYYYYHHHHCSKSINHHPLSLGLSILAQPQPSSSGGHSTRVSLPATSYRYITSLSKKGRRECFLLIGYR